MCHDPVTWISILQMKVFFASNLPYPTSQLKIKTLLQSEAPNE